MRPENMKWTGTILLVLGAALVIISGVFYYAYFQDLLAATGSATTGSPASVANSLAILNGTSATPIFTTLAILGLGLMVSGAVYAAGGNIAAQMTSQPLPRVSINPATPVAQVPQAPSRACTKCGTLLFQATAFCPTCGNPIARTQPIPA